MSNIEVEVVGVRIEMPANQPILLLKATEPAYYLPIWVGAIEANALSIAQRGLTPPRPMAHALLLDTLEAYETSLADVTITGRDGQIFLAELHTNDGKSISARPSDAVTLALTAQCPVYVDSELLEESGIEAPAADEEEVAQFRDFLDNVSAEDFETGTETP
ncbi:bifunctional nuclease family protein [Brevibacterium sp. RIT 803]|uniref:bifunctional nuclease family protein n=1 Tax=Brevibacterium sp. RIT 803 TaxID=2810210 RepID=UPI00195248CB|nr:bifunctional nuclease family protein [Brevibacterium sp. RIT 803]MBM6592336.1 bifunctional nuclease family protein [Brevibacterium sp. RIT 803]